MEYDDRTVEVEFSSNDGTTYAMETLTGDLLVLHDNRISTSVFFATALRSHRLLRLP